MMKNSKLKFSEYMQNVSGSKSFGRSALIVSVLFVGGLVIQRKNLAIYKAF